MEQYTVTGMELRCLQRSCGKGGGKGAGRDILFGQSVDEFYECGRFGDGTGDYRGGGKSRLRGG